MNLDLWLPAEVEQDGEDHRQPDRDRDHDQTADSPAERPDTDGAHRLLLWSSARECAPVWAVERVWSVIVMRHWVPASIEPMLELSPER